MTDAPSPPDIAITYRRSGGLAGIDMVAQLRSGELTDDDAAAARSMLARAPAAAGTAPPGRPDRFDHELELDDGASRRTFHWSDNEIPDEARALVATLGRRAEPTRG